MGLEVWEEYGFNQLIKVKVCCTCIFGAAGRLCLWGDIFMYVQRYVCTYCT